MKESINDVYMFIIMLIKLSVRELFHKYPLKCVCVWKKMHKNSTVLNKNTDHLQHKSAEKRNGWVYT